MAVVVFKGKRYFEYEGKRYALEGKPFEKLLNKKRKEGVKLFDKITIGGTDYIMNPVVSGKGSRDPLVALEYTTRGKLTKRSEKQIDQFREIWMKPKVDLVYRYETVGGEQDIYTLFDELQDKPYDLRLVASNGVQIAFKNERKYNDFRRYLVRGSDDYLFGAGEILVFYMPTILRPSRVLQMFRDGRLPCVFTPIIRKLDMMIENGNCSKETIKRHRQRRRAMVELQEEYPLGVPEDMVETVAKKAGMALHVDYMFQQPKVYNEKGKVATISYINNRLHHLEEGKMVMNNDFDFVNEDEMRLLYKKAVREYKNGNDDYFFTLEGNLKEDCPSKLRMINRNVQLYDEDNEMMRKFTQESDVNKYMFNATKYPDVNAFMKAGRIVNAWPTELSQEEPTNHIDMPKAYTQFKGCKYYDGFMGAIQQWRSGSFDKKFIKEHIGMYRMRVVSCKNELFAKLGIVDGSVHILPSVEIIFFMENGMDVVIDCGVWGSRFDLSFPDYMLENRRYCYWTGRLGMENTHKQYTFPGTMEYAEHLQASVEPNHEVMFWKDKKLITVKVPKSNVYTNHHIMAFITSYTRIQMLEAMMTIGVNNLCKVVMDGIYFKGKTPSTLDWFVEKEMKQHGYTLNYWYDGSNVDVAWDTCKYENNVFLGGQGGAGKSYSILTDKCYNNILYVCPQHTLGQKQRKIYGVNYTTVHQLLGIGIQAYNQIRGIPPVIFWDEITQCPAEWVEKGLKMYNQSLIILAGDIDKDGMYYQTRMEVGDMYKPTIDYAFIDGDRRSRDDDLKKLKLTIRERMRKIFSDGKSGEEVLMTQWALNHLNVVSLEQAVHQFCVGDTWIAGTHKTNAHLLEAGVASGWYKKGGWISDVEKEGYQKRGSFTIHSYQGSTIETGKVFISIHDMFDFTMLYTAVSRAVHFNQLIFVA